MGLTQVANAAASSRHWKVAPLGPVNVEVALVLAAGFAGVEVMVGAATVGLDAAAAARPKATVAARSTPMIGRTTRLTVVAELITYP